MNYQKERAKDRSNIRIAIYLNSTCSRQNAKLSLRNIILLEDTLRSHAMQSYFSDSSTSIEIKVWSQSTSKSSSRFLSVSDLPSMSGMQFLFPYLMSFLG